MADLVLGLAKSAVEGTLTMAKSAIEEEKKLKNSVQRDLMLISDEFEMMHAFLNVTKDHATDDMTRTVVRQVRNMALDVEDCIESVVHLDNKSDWWRGLVPSCMLAAAPAAALEDTASAIELLKSRVEAMGQRNIRYSHIGDSGSMSTKTTHRQDVANATALETLMEARDTKEKHNGPGDLIQLINRKSDVLPLQVISVWGAGGDLGAASIIKKAYDDPEISRNFRCRAWVKLMHPFNPHEFIRSLLVQFSASYCLQQGSGVGFLKPVEVMVATEDVLVQEFIKLMGDQRYLVILEELSSIVDWEAVRVYLPDKNNGSCIVVRTQQLEIASLCIGHSHQVLELERFSSDHSICIFFKENVKNSEEAAKAKAEQDWSKGNQFFDRHTDIWELSDRIRWHRTKVMNVYGIAGVGKSSVVKHVYYKQVTEGTFQKFGWVNVSHPFNLRDFSWSLLLDLHSGSLQHCSILRIKDPIQECHELLHQHSCLVVIDGLESAEDWSSIEATFAIGHSQSRVIVISNEQCVNEHFETCLWNIPGLELDEALALFKQKVSEKTSQSYQLSPHLIEQARHILHKCGGLPKVIVAVADFVSANRYFHTSLLIESFMEVLETHSAFGRLRDLFAWVHSYFLSCPDFLKPCVFYLSIFPLNYIIRRKRLVRRWIAEGYSRDTQEETAEEKADGYFFKLAELSIIQLREWTILTIGLIMPLCQVNGFFREYIVTRSMEENLVFGLEGHCSMNLQHTGRHLAIGSTWDRDRNVFASIDVSRLRSLTVFGEWKSFFISNKMRLLRVLDLEDTSGVTNGDLEQMVKLLPRLKFLSLRGCREVTRLPHFLDVLRQLQTLDIRDTSITTLPKSIVKLQKLQYICAGTTPGLDDETIIDEGLPTPPSTIAPLPKEVEPPAMLPEPAAKPRPPLIVEETPPLPLVPEASSPQPTAVPSPPQPAALGAPPPLPPVLAASLPLLTAAPASPPRPTSPTSSPPLTAVAPPPPLIAQAAQPPPPPPPPLALALAPQSPSLAAAPPPVEVKPPLLLAGAQSPSAVTATPPIEPAAATPPPPPPPALAAGLATSPSLSAKPLMSRSHATVMSTWLSKFSLRRRLAGSRNGGVQVPRQIGNLIALHTLAVVNISAAGGKAILKELKNLTQLRKLGVSGINLDNCMEFFSAISEYGHLVSLSLQLDEYNQAGCLDGISSETLENLKSLKLYGLVGKLPEWIARLENLRKLSLQMTRLPQEGIDVLGDLMNLQLLRLSLKEFQDGELQFSSSLYGPSILEVTSNSRIQAISFHFGYFNCELLKIRFRSRVSSLRLSGIGNLPRLKEVWLGGSYDDAVKQQLQSQLAKDQGRRGIKPVVKEDPWSSSPKS